jgi:hypothetical protein
MSKKYALLDGEAMNREHPDTFGLPSNHEIGNLRKGNYIKIGATFAPNRRNGSNLSYGRRRSDRLRLRIPPLNVSGCY